MYRPLPGRQRSPRHCSVRAKRLGAGCAYAAPFDDSPSRTWTWPQNPHHAAECAVEMTSCRRGRRHETLPVSTSPRPLGTAGTKEVPADTGQPVEHVTSCGKACDTSVQPWALLGSNQRPLPCEREKGPFRGSCQTAESAAMPCPARVSASHRHSSNRGVSQRIASYARPGTGLFRFRDLVDSTDGVLFPVARPHVLGESSSRGSQPAPPHALKVELSRPNVSRLLTSWIPDHPPPAAGSTVFSAETGSHAFGPLPLVNVLGASLGL
jgi:hypothetical protein